MGLERRKRRAICAICRKPIAEDEPHYRAGVAWLHLKCYEKVTPDRKRPR